MAAASSLSSTSSESSSLFRRAFGGSTSSNLSGNNNATAADGSAAVRRSSLSSMHFGTNMFKRFAERMLSIQDSREESTTEPELLQLPAPEPCSESSQSGGKAELGQIC